MNTTDFKLEERTDGWWVIEGAEEHMATPYEIALWVNLLAARSKQSIPPITWLGVFVLAMICGTILGSVYLIFGGC